VREHASLRTAGRARGVHDGRHGILGGRVRASTDLVGGDGLTEALQGLEAALGDRGATVVGVGTGEGLGARSGFRKAAGSVDDAGVTQVAGGGEGDGGFNIAIKLLIFQPHRPFLHLILP
jgi:hypothetical protein